MISKDKFFEILNYFQENEQFEESLRQLLKNSVRSTDFMDAAMFTDCKMIDYVIYLLEDNFNDSSEGWIGYWIYELNYGKEWRPGCVTLKDGTDIKLQSKEDLYNFLIKNKD